MPQRPGFMASNPSPFGSSLFSSTWGSGRDRSTTLQSIASVGSNGPTSPSHSSFSRESLADTDVKTLDYLGLVDTPQQARATLAPSDIEILLQQQRMATQSSALSAFKNANRFRSYSVNAKEKYEAEEDEDDLYGMDYAGTNSGTLTPSAADSAAAYAIHEAVRRHNLEVQAFANFASANRPRARTAGVLDSPSTRLMRNYMPTPSRLDNNISASDLPLNEEAEYSGLTEAVQSLQLNGKPTTDLGGDESTLEGPTRALWLGNIPASTTISSLNVIFSPYGSIESTRVLTHKNCGFVNFETLDSAVRAKQQLNGKEIFPGAGPVRIGYAKVPSASGTPGNNGLYPSPSPDPLAKSQMEGAASDISSGQTNDRHANGGRIEAVPPPTPTLPDIRHDIVEIVRELGATDEEQMRVASNVELAIQHDNYEPEIPPIPEPSHNRVHDAPKLRDIRKRIDNQSCTQAEIEEVAMGMLSEIAELSSDYLGNTVVQKLFEHCSEDVKEAMLEQIAPHLAEIGVHKNGTWAAQKIIDVARTPRLMQMVVDSLRTYSKALFFDQFGNYVMQGCLRYQYPLNNFIFEVMLSRLWELAQNRFGARAMRACLESHYATKDQQRMVAAAIALHSVQLATNANGALLLTWFLDTCTFPKRRSVLAPRLVPHLVHLCTHKVAYLTVLKIINQRNEPEARDAILQALFFSPNDQVLEDILRDQSCGATLIFKVLTTPFFDEQIRAEVVANVRGVLLRIKAQPAQGYKRLMDEVNLSTRGAGVAGRDGHGERDSSQGPRPGSKHSLPNGNMPAQPTMENQMNRQFYPGMPQASLDPQALQRTASMDSGGFDQYQLGGVNAPVYTSTPTMPMAAMAPQLQYQQTMMASARPGAYYPQMNGYSSPGTPLDAFRNVSPAQMASPAMTPAPMMPQAGFAQPPFGGVMNPQMYQYQMQYVPPQQQVGAGRRGRVSAYRGAM